MNPIHLPNQPLTVTFRLFRHGAKDSDNGELSKLGLDQATKYGKNLVLPTDNVRIFSSRKSRVVDTVEAVCAACSEISDDAEMQFSDALSAGAMLFDIEKSDFFKRFKKYPQTTAEEIKQMEDERMHFWLSHEDEQPDAGTASPKQVYDGLINFFNREISALDGGDGEKILYLCGTHEFMIAALVHYLIGDRLDKPVGRIKYLEDMQITVDAKTVSLTFRDHTYKL